MNKQNTEHMFINMHRMHKEKMMLTCHWLCRKKTERKKSFSQQEDMWIDLKRRRLAATASTKLKGEDSLKDSAGEA